MIRDFSECSFKITIPRLEFINDELRFHFSIFPNSCCIEQKRDENENIVTVTDRDKQLIVYLENIIVRDNQNSIVFSGEYSLKFSLEKKDNKYFVLPNSSQYTDLSYYSLEFYFYDVYLNRYVDIYYYIEDKRTVVLQGINSYGINGNSRYSKRDAEARRLEKENTDLKNIVSDIKAKLVRQEIIQEECIKQKKIIEQLKVQNEELSMKLRTKTFENERLMNENVDLSYSLESSKRMYYALKRKINPKDDYIKTKSYKEALEAADKPVYSNNNDIMDW